MKQAPRIHYAWWILLACCCLNVGVLGIVNYCAGIFYQPVVQELGISMGAMGLHVSIRSIVMAASMPLVSRLLPGPHIGKILAAASAVCFACFGLMSIFRAIWQWYLTAAVMGVACAFLLFVPTPLLINNWFHKKSGLALGIALSCSGISGSVWTIVGSKIIENAGWRIAYLALSLIGAIITIPILLLVVRFKPAEKGLLPYGMTLEEAAALPPVDALNQPQKKKSLLPTLKNSNRSVLQFMLVLVACCLMANSAGYIAYLPSYTESLGYTAAVGASLTSIAMLGSVAWKLALGWMRDHIGVKGTTFIGCSSAALAFIIMIYPNHSVLLLRIGGFLYGAAPAVMAILPALITQAALGKEHFGEIYSYITIGTSLVSAVAATAIGSIYDLTGSYNFGFLVGVLCCAAAVLLSLLSLSNQKK